MKTYEQAVLDLAGPVPASFATFHPGPNATLVEILRACAVGQFSLATPAACTSDHGPNDPNNALTAPWIYLTGAVGSGRSHLLLASCQAARNQGHDALYLGLSRPPAHLPPDLPGMEQVALIALDDIDQVATDRAWEEGLFHFLNRARASGSWVLMSARQGPQEAGFSLPDLRSRLSWGQRHKLKALDDTDLLQVVKIHAQARGLPLDDKLLRYLFNHCERHTNSLLGVLVQLQQAAFAAKRKPSLALLVEVLQSPRQAQTAQTTSDNKQAASASDKHISAPAAEQDGAEQQATRVSIQVSGTSELPAAPWAHPEYIPSNAPPSGPTMRWEQELEQQPNDPKQTWEVNDSVQSNTQQKPPAKDHKN